jgi:hypothetical protein
MAGAAHSYVSGASKVCTPGRAMSEKLEQLMNETINHLIRVMTFVS